MSSASSRLLRLVPGVGQLPGAAMPVSISARLPNEPGMADDADTERVTFTIANLRSINSKRLYALVDVEIRVAGLSFRIIGVQIQRGTGGLSVHLPTHRDITVMAAGSPWSRCPKSCVGR